MTNFDADRPRDDESERDTADGGRFNSSREESVGGQPNRRSYSVPGSTAAGTTTLAEAETHYDREIEDTDEWRYLERMEQRHGARFHQWIREGVPTDAMQSDADIEAYRERKGTPVPWDIETFNRRSVWRNVGEASRRLRRGPAGRTSVPEVVREVISSRGRSLDNSVRETVEERMGESFDDVQIHTDARAADAAEAIDARAFTVGNHIVFNHGEYDPESPEGQRVLIHELVHVRQQTGGELSMLPQEDVALEVDSDPRREREADETAQRVVSGGALGVRQLAHTEVHVQRLPAWADKIGLPHPEEAADALAVLEEKLDPELAEEVRQTVEDDRYDEFLEDVWRIATASKDLGNATGDVGEVLSSHPEVGLVEGFADDFEERDELSVVPGGDNMVKGFELETEDNPELDKLIVNTEELEVVAGVEEKTGDSSDDWASEAVKQAESNIKSIREGGIPTDENNTPNIKNIERMSDFVSDLTGADFEGAEAYAVVPRGQDDADEDDNTDPAQVTTYRWDSDTLSLMYKVVKQLSPW